MTSEISNYDLLRLQENIAKILVCVSIELPVFIHLGLLAEESRKKVTLSRKEVHTFTI